MTSSTLTNIRNFILLRNDYFANENVFIFATCVCLFTRLHKRRNQ